MNNADITNPSPRPSSPPQKEVGDPNVLDQPLQDDSLATTEEVTPVLPIPLLQQLFEEGWRTIQVQIEQLRQDFETKLMYDASKERQIDQLHQELQKNREGLFYQVLHPVFMDLIALHDDLSKLIENLATQEPSPLLERMGKNLFSFQESIEEILERYGVTSFSEENDIFTSGRQRAIKALDSDKSEMDKKVARRLRKGFQYENRVFRPEWVEVYRYVSPDVC